MSVSEELLCYHLIVYSESIPLLFVTKKHETQEKRNIEIQFVQENITRNLVFMLYTVEGHSQCIDIFKYSMYNIIKCARNAV